MTPRSPRRRRRKSAPAPTSQFAAAILDTLEGVHPDATCALHHRNPYELVVATILSAQCTDERVNMVTPALFARYPTPVDMAVARPADLEALIRSTGFFRAKTKSLIGCTKAIVVNHGGMVPSTMEALVKLPGIGRKTANVVLGHAFGVNEGVAVDTHVARVTNRLGLARSEDPLEIERQLMKLIPRGRWTKTTDLIIFHGRRICEARRPRCGACPIFALCRWEHRQAYAHGGDGRPLRRPRRTTRRGARR